MARSVCRAAARAALRGRELRGAKVQVVWHGAGGGGALGRGLEGAEGACSRGVYALAVCRRCAEHRRYCAVRLCCAALLFAVPASSGLMIWQQLNGKGERPSFELGQRERMRAPMLSLCAGSVRATGEINKCRKKNEQRTIRRAKWRGDYCLQIQVGAPGRWWCVFNETQYRCLQTASRRRRLMHRHVCKIIHGGFSDALTNLADAQAVID